MLDGVVYSQQPHDHKQSASSSPSSYVSSLFPLMSSSQSPSIMLDGVVFSQSSSPISKPLVTKMPSDTFTSTVLRFKRARDDASFALVRAHNNDDDPLQDILFELYNTTNESYQNGMATKFVSNQCDTKIDDIADYEYSPVNPKHSHTSPSLSLNSFDESHDVNSTQPKGNGHEIRTPPASVVCEPLRFGPLPLYSSWQPVGSQVYGALFYSKMVSFLLYQLTNRNFVKNNNQTALLYDTLHRLYAAIGDTCFKNIFNSFIEKFVPVKFLELFPFDMTIRDRDHVIGVLLDLTTWKDLFVFGNCCSKLCLQVNRSRSYLEHNMKTPTAPQPHGNDFALQTQPLLGQDWVLCEDGYGVSFLFKNELDDKEFSALSSFRNIMGNVVSTRVHVYIFKMIHFFSFLSPVNLSVMSMLCILAWYGFGWDDDDVQYAIGLMNGN